MLIISVCNKRQNLRVEHAEGPLEFGRGPERAVKRIMLEDIYVSRDQLVIEELADSHIRVENLSQKRAIHLNDGSVLEAGGRRDLYLPAFLAIGETQIGIEREITEDFDKASLQTIPEPIARRPEPAAPSAKLHDLGDSPPPEKLASWMERVLTLQQSAADTPDFLKQTARAVVEMIGLDIGMVLLRKSNEWTVAAGYAAHDRGTMHYSRTLVNHVATERRTFFQDLEALADRAASLQAVDAVVASPIFGIHDDVAGVLYAARNRAVRGRIGIRPLEAQIVQLLAAAVSNNLARAAAIRTRVQFEQFFSPELVGELERNPNLLEGRSLEVTILVSDLRGFTGLSERLGASNTCTIIRDLMEHLTERIAGQGGVIVDYAGDGILAMWNAPVLQPDHALRACRAAQAMQAEMPALNARWQHIVGAPLHLGIGINTGQAQVGNTGCSRKFKYGPHGHTVNLAARVQDATKRLAAPILITGSVREKIQDFFVCSKTEPVPLHGVKEEVVLYELGPETAPGRNQELSA
jgi:adenylate cyclase